MTHDEIHAFVDRFARAWSAQDLDALLECYDERAEVVSPVFRTVNGIAAIERSFQDLFLAFSSVSTDVHDIVIDAVAQGAVLVFTTHATQQGEFLGFPGSGRRTSTQMAFVFHFRGGRIISERRLYDFTGVLMQLGILKARGAK